ncbi:MAG: hypothetical protein J5794_08075, partial [Lachnospiraceae bacterium]|nr:hypothetical protein [Lachnospiraceae bacterium]
FDYPESAQVAVVSDTPWVDKNWEALDITEGMTPEEKAAYEAAMGELENFNADEFQAGIDEMLQDQEGFEDYQPSSSPGDPKVSTEWPDSAIARQLPKPPFTRSMVVEEENSVMLTNNTATLQEVKAYVSEVKKAGFTESVNENEQNIAGYSIYTFTAENSAGYVVSIQFMAGTMTLSITR